MIIKSLELENFRNYKKAFIEFDSFINILVGLNAQGKTNILESIYLIATSKSQRVQKNTELINFGAEQAIVSIRSTSQMGSNYFNLQVKADDNKQIHINGKKIKKATDLLGYLNVVLFSPEDLSLVTGAPSERRRFIDVFISQVKPRYAVTLNDYNKVLKQRNKTLKDINNRICGKEMLEIWDQQLIGLALSVVSDRVEAINRIEKIANKFYSAVSENRESLAIEYVSGIFGKDKLLVCDYKEKYTQKLTSSYRMDLMQGTTSYGPHRDDVILKLNQHEAKLYGSQGQKRLVSLSLKYAEVEYIREKTGEYPVLLFDDVLLELDLKRKNKLFEEFLKKVQIIITTTDLKRYEEILVNESAIFHINEGSIEKVDSYE